MTKGRKIGVGVGVVLVAGALAVALWPTKEAEVGYPFARRLLGQQPQPLWELSREELLAAASRDTERAERANARLERVVEEAREQHALLEREDVERLTGAQRQSIRLVWWSFLDPLLELDTIKHRWEHWYGIDYRRNPDLHAMGYALTYASLVGQVNAGQAFLDLVIGNARVQALFDEALPSFGLPAGTFTAFRNQMTRARDQSFIAVGDEWYDAWIARHLREGDEATRLRALVRSERQSAARSVRARAVVATVRNKTELLRNEAFDAWFPVQVDVAMWFGDTRVVSADRRLIADAQLAEMGRALRPGDIIVERRNWYLSNVGLPGFWPHAALYMGTQDAIREALDDDPAVQEHFGTLSETLATRHPDAWAALGERDREGHPHVIFEAVSEGVVAASLEHSCGADYVAAMRPNLSALEIARALDRAMGYFGRPYDFEFDFGTDDALVCSELVIKAYEPEADSPGLRIDPVEIIGKLAVPPTEIVRAFSAGRGREDAPLGFVYFLDGRERGHEALVADADALAASCDRPKWDVLQR